MDLCQFTCKENPWFFEGRIKSLTELLTPHKGARGHDASDCSSLRRAGVEFNLPAQVEGAGASRHHAGQEIRRRGREDHYNSAGTVHFIRAVTTELDLLAPNGRHGNSLNGNLHINDVSCVVLNILIKLCQS